MKFYKIVLTSVICFGLSFFNSANAAWKNNTRTDFLNNSLIIYTINIRTFNADDKNGNGIIEFDKGETSGNFINAISRLDELKNKGINALHILPITPVGKMKALGTAGSLYSAASFNSLNPQLKDNNTNISVEDQARSFIRMAHEKGIAVIVDVPACGSYDLFLQSPELFVKDESGQPVIPSDWTDVRLFDTGTESKLNNDVVRLYEKYVDYVMSLGVDGIRADVAHSKPAQFWKEVINYSRQKDSQFLWLAESSDSWKEAVSPKAVYTPYDKLLKAGFDGFYGSFFNLKNWEKASELRNQVKMVQNLEKLIGEKKSVIGSFTTHDELSPILEKGVIYSRMIMWLNATLPVNSYFVDGFDTGDTYLYPWENQKASVTYTDDEDYFVHRGKIDIFNFSRKPSGKNIFLEEEFAKSNKTKQIVLDILKTGEFKFLKTSSDRVFAYMINDAKRAVIVVGNLDFKNPIENVKITMPKFYKIDSAYPVALLNLNAPKTENNKFITDLYSGEIQVFIIENEDK